MDITFKKDINYIYMPTDRQVWKDIAIRLEGKGMKPVIWLGDPVHDVFAKERFSACEVYDFFDIQKRPINEEVNHFPEAELFKSKEFFVLKEQVYKIMDRQDSVRIYGRLEREAVFYSMFVYFYSKIKELNVKCVVASEGPHSPVQMTIYGISKMLGLENYHLVQNGMLPLVHVVKDFYGKKIEAVPAGDKEQFKLELVKYFDKCRLLKEIPDYIKKQLDHDKKKSGLLSVCGWYFKGVKKYIRSLVGSYDDVDDYYINNRFSFKGNGRTFFSYYEVKMLRDFLKKKYESSVSDVSLDSSYIYFPLHYEPERTSNPDGGHYFNAIDALLALREFVPRDIPIYVKEHPSQFSSKLYGYRGRSPYFYDLLKSINNVFLIDLEVSSHELIKKSALVASQAGTACLEASVIGKKSIIFGYPWFSGFPNIFDFDELDSFEELISFPVLSQEKEQDFINEYIDLYAIPGCVNFSGDRTFHRRYPEQAELMLDNDVMSYGVSETIFFDLHSRVMKLSS